MIPVLRVLLASWICLYCLAGYSQPVADWRGAWVADVDDGSINADTVAGLWLSGNGTNKQYFISKRHKSGLRGLVCGPCDNPLVFAPLDNIRLEDTTLHFDIVHEDNGFGFAEHGPFRNLTQARIAMNEMLLSTVASYEPDAPPFEMTLLGPVQFRP